MSQGRTYLLTGVTGFLGKVVLEELLRRREELNLERVYVPIRARGTTTAADRFTHEVAPSPCFAKLEANWTRFVQVLSGDLEQPNFGLSPDNVPPNITHIVHSAASVSFDLPVAEAARSNIVTTLNVLAFAKTCPRLERFVAVSTAYVTPATGDLTPAPEALAPLPRPAKELFALMQAPVSKRAERRLLRSTGHPNTYTLTKCIAEHLLMQTKGHVPVTIVRPSIISASVQYPFPGWIDSKAGFAGFVVLLGAGHLRAVVGHLESRLDLIPVDEVTHRILTACNDQGNDARILYATAGVAHSPTIQECWTGIREFFHLNRVHRPPALRYVGPRDVKFRMADALHHGVPTAVASIPGSKLRRKSKSLRGRINYVNRVFPYFTSHTFDFQTSAPLEESFDAKAYVQVVCRGVHRHVLRADQRQWTLAGAKHLGHGGDLAWSLKQPEGNLWIRFASWAVTKVLRKTFDRVTVDVASLETARAAVPEGSSIVIAATHRSYLDFILVSYLAFARPDVGIPIPHIAATMEFGKLPVLGRILSAMHAFYLRRGTGKEDPELTARVHELMRQGKTLEFFIEGQRSRSREFLEPKRGLLRALQATGKPVTILPISLSYDRVPEERSFAAELAGSPKPKMRLTDLVRWTGRALRGKVKLGRAHIACGAPIALRADTDIRQLSQAIVAELKSATVATTFHLEAFLQHNPRPGLDVSGLRRTIEERQGVVLDSTLPVPADLNPKIAWTLQHHFLHHLEGAVHMETRPSAQVSPLKVKP